MFKPIKGYEDYMINENGVVINKKGHVMRPADNENKGYLRYALEVYDDNGKLLHRDNLFAHRLVAENFIPNPNNLPIVMHKDNDPGHCHYTNLKWGTNEENIQQRVDENRSAHIHTSRNYVYNVYNDFMSDIHRCNGRKGVAELVGFKSDRSVKSGMIIGSGEYKGYKVEKTSEKVRVLVSFEERLKGEPQLIE